MEGTLEMDGDCNKGMGAVVLETPLGCNEEKGDESICHIFQWNAGLIV